jgi:hypothetical protein
MTNVRLSNSRKPHRIGDILFTIALILARWKAYAQDTSCPIDIDSVIRQQLSSDMGQYGSALQITIHNTSPFPILGVELAIQSTNQEKNTRPYAIVSYHVLASNATDTLMWNSTRFDKKNGTPQAFIVWPALIQFNDGSKWIGNSTQCNYMPSVATRVEETINSETQTSEQELQNMIAKGQASLVNVTSEPTGANVDVDGVLLGKTPLAMVLMKGHNGKARNVMVYKDGFTIRDRDVRPSGGTMTIHERLYALPTVR